MKYDDIFWLGSKQAWVITGIFEETENNPSINNIIEFKDKKYKIITIEKMHTFFPLENNKRRLSVLCDLINEI